MHRPDEDSEHGSPPGIRPYRAGDREACLHTLEGNTPEFFVGKDRVEYAAFLDHLPGPYFVIEGGALRACGGWAMDDDGVAVLTWGLVRNDLHRKGIGSALLRYRLSRIRDDGRAGLVRVRTVQFVQAFFAREGFEIVDVAADGYGPGLDRVTMQLALDSRAPQTTEPRG